jgi:hypothetical protein
VTEVAKTKKAKFDPQTLPRKRMTGNEREAFLRLMTTVDILHKQRPELAQRVRLIPGGLRDYGLVVAKAQALCENLLHTLPNEQLETLLRNIPHMAYTVGTKMFSRGDHDSEYGMWISFKALDPISEVIHEHCMLCMKDTQEQRQCPLAKALDTLPSDKKDYAPGCGYFGLV